MSSAYQFIRVVSTGGRKATNIVYFIILQFHAVASEISFSSDVKCCRRALVPRKELMFKEHPDILNNLDCGV